jgi:hypothetical protein
MDKESTHGKMAVSTKGATITTRSMVREPTHILIAPSTQVSGKMVSSTELDQLWTQIATTSAKVYGPTAN